MKLLFSWEKLRTVNYIIKQILHYNCRVWTRRVYFTYQSLAVHLGRGLIPCLLNDLLDKLGRDVDHLRILHHCRPVDGVSLARDPHWKLFLRCSGRCLGRWQPSQIQLYTLYHYTIKTTEPLTLFKILGGGLLNIVRCEMRWWFLSPGSTAQVVGAASPGVLLDIGVSSQFVQSLHGPLLDQLLSSLHYCQQSQEDWVRLSETELDWEREEWEMRGREEGGGTYRSYQSRQVSSHLSPLTPDKWSHRNQDSDSDCSNFYSPSSLIFQFNCNLIIVVKSLISIIASPPAPPLTRSQHIHYRWSLR